MVESSKDTYLLLFGIMVILGIGFLFWKSTSANGGVKITEFVRDAEGRVIQIIEK